MLPPSPLSDYATAQLAPKDFFYSTAGRESMTSRENLKTTRPVLLEAISLSRVLQSNLQSPYMPSTPPSDSESHYSLINTIPWTVKFGPERLKEQFLSFLSAIKTLQHDPQLRPQLLSEFLTQYQWSVDRKMQREKQKLSQHEEIKRLQELGIPQLQTAFRGKSFKGNNGAVLSYKTVFCVNWETKERAAAKKWPLFEELFWEGDYRLRIPSNKEGRFLPLMRNHTFGCVCWKDLTVMTPHVIKPHAFDNMEALQCPEPTGENHMALSQPLEHDDISLLLSHELLAALDDD